MLPPDARYLSLEVQQYLRQQAIHLRETGATFEDISQFLGLHRDTVSRWWKAYLRQGEAALTQKTRGRKAGEHSRLTAEQCRELEQLLKDYYPNEMGIDSALWSRRALQTLIEQRYGILVPPSISAQGTVRFKLYLGRMDATVVIEFLSRLVKSVERKVILILDQHPVHRCKVLKDWLEEHQQEIEVFYLPSYSRELNPAEYLNCDVKAGVHSKPPTQSVEELRMRVLSHLRKLQKLPGRVRKYFEHDEIAYAANG